MYDIIIKNGMLIDGTGARMFRADIGVKEDMIAHIGDLRNDAAKQVIDASGQYVAPGFIDVDNHSDAYWQIFSNPHLESLMYQGITTIVVGNCGSSLAPLADASMLQSIQKWSDIRKVNLNWLTMKEFLVQMEQNRLSVNFATLSGHGTLRRGLVRDETRALESGELASLLKMLKQSLKEGSFGCSLGLEYAHARSASGRELVSVAETLKKQKSVCVVHMRDESSKVVESVEEAIGLARETGCGLHLSHLKVAGRECWHLMERVLYLIESANSSGIDVTFDIYPYTSTGTVLYTILPDWVTEGGKKMMIERLKDASVRREVVVELREQKIHYASVVLQSSSLSRMLARQSIEAIAENQGIAPEEALIDVLIASGGRAIASMEVLSEENIEKAIQNPFSVIGTNGSGYSVEYGKTSDKVHPRSFGAFPLVLSLYVREKKLLSWEEAVHKMSGKPAEKFDIERRGVLRKGNYADIVVFHPSQIGSSATYQDPYRYANGMSHILVNGILSVKEGEYQGVRAGSVLRKTSSWF